MLTQIPVGLDEIIHTFGSLDDPNFESHNIVLFTLPYPLKYEGQIVTKARAHRLAVDNFVQGFRNVQAAGFADKFVEFNGIYARRSIRGQASHPSAHSWGIAIDMEAFDTKVGDAATHPLGSQRRLPEPIVAAMQAAGFFYGGDFKSRKDPMHFQLATHY